MAPQIVLLRRDPGRGGVAAGVDVGAEPEGQAPVVLMVV
jgi:hypothetical protein